MDYTIIAFFGLWLSTTWGIQRLFPYIEDTLKDDTKKQIGSWLLNVGNKQTNLNWANQFVELFNKVFGEKHFLYKCMMASFYASMLICLTFSFTCYIVTPDIIENINHVTEGTFFDESKSGGNSLFVVFFLFMMINVYADYFSLFETRYCLKLLQKTTNIYLWIGILVLDFFLTILIIWLILRFHPPSLGYLGVNSSSEMDEIIFKQGIYFQGNWAFVGIFFYSTFLTSIWIWLYVFSGLIIKTLNKTKAGYSFLKKHLDIENKPLRSMGSILFIVMTFGFVIWGIYIFAI